MALTAFQLEVCRLIARHRVASGESYVAGGAALGAATASSRVSRDIDVFHDTTEAVAASWDGDRRLLEASGFDVRPTRERPGFAEAIVTRGSDGVELQWTSDSAFRFFPLVEHADFGLALHPFDLATNKVLALVGRVEVRDWVDVIACHDRIQRLGLLAWAACGKDPGFSPASILDHAARTARYSAEEFAALAFAGAPPDLSGLSRRWHAALEEAREIVSLLPAGQSGTCVLDTGGVLWTGDVAALRTASSSDGLRYHPGSIRRALPQVRSA